MTVTLNPARDSGRRKPGGRKPPRPASEDRILIGYCRDCKRWEDEDTESFRICGKLRPPRSTDLANAFAILPSQAFMDNRGEEAGLETMPNFGCVMWEAKDE